MCKSKITIIVAGSMLAMLLACDQNTDRTKSLRASSTATGQMPTRQYQPEQLELGGQIFAKHCAGCHGDKAQGNENWRVRDENGKFLPPPLNGNGHAWHHSRAVLRNVIENGSVDGSGNMPAWKDKLSDAEIDAVISWFQSLWPDAVYASWYEMQQRK